MRGLAAAAAAVVAAALLLSTKGKPPLKSDPKTILAFCFLGTEMLLYSRSLVSVVGECCLVLQLPLLVGGLEEGEHLQRGGENTL